MNNSSNTNFNAQNTYVGALGGPNVGVATNVSDNTRVSVGGNLFDRFNPTVNVTHTTNRGNQLYTNFTTFTGFGGRTEHRTGVGFRFNF